ncbi:hypothetical protein HanIR_Chr10g0476551 [Helianthus annuus]|nr:hypothetical protein HanIR_Chr10g0476551 [Helianthus annuus]
MEYPIRLIHKLGSIMVNPFLLQSAFGETSMLGFANESFEMMLGWDIRDAMQIASSAESVGNDICFAWVIMNLTVVIVEKFYPSALTHIKFFLVEYVL